MRLSGSRYKVNIHYVVGNHDWFLHVPGPDFDKVRAAVIAAMGLANTEDLFPYDPYKSARLQQVFRDHDMFARHGDIFDSFNYGQDRKASSLGMRLSSSC